MSSTVFQPEAAEHALDFNPDLSTLRAEMLTFLDCFKFSLKYI